MRKIIIGLLLLLSVGASAQWQQTGSKVRYVTGIGIPTKDTAAGVLADSSQILIRPADSSLYVKYKRTWMRVGGGGGSIAGSGTTNYIPKFTSSSAIGNSQIFDNGTRVGIGYGGASAYKFGVQFSQSSNTVDGFILTSSTLSKSYAIWAANAIGGSLWGLSNPYTGFINYTSGDATSYINDGGGYFSWHNSTAELMRLTNSGNVGIGTASPNSTLDVNKGSQSAGGSTPSGALLIANRTAGNGILELGTNASAVSWLQSRNSTSASYYDLALQPSGGNVGIGTTSPALKLNVKIADATAYTTTSRGNVLRLDNDIAGGTGNYVGIEFAASGDNSTQNVALSGINGVSGGDGLGIITFYTRNGNGSTWAERMRINSAGNVGIGTTSPAAKLSVQGTTLINTNTDNGVDKLQVNGSISGIGMKQAYVTKTGAYTATDADYVIDCTSGTFTVTLPASSGRTGRILIIKNSGAGTITVDGNAAETIDGAATYSLAVQYATVQIMSDGTNWKIISKF